MAYLEGFDASKIDPTGPMTPVPAGTYTAAITASERKKNKNSGGEHLELKLSIAAGPHKGRSITTRLNLWHENKVAKEIAWREMSAICRSVGIMNPKDSCDLHNLPLEIVVGLTNPNAQGKMYNEITGYAKRGAAAAPATPPPQAPTPQANAGNGGSDDAAGAAVSAPRPSWMG